MRSIACAESKELIVRTREGGLVIEPIELEFGVEGVKPELRLL